MNADRLAGIKERARLWLFGSDPARLVGEEILAADAIELIDALCEAHATLAAVRIECNEYYPPRPLADRIRAILDGGKP